MPVTPVKAEAVAAVPGPRGGAQDTSFAPTIVLMLGRSVGFLATFLMPVVLARVFDPAHFGAYKQLFLVFATIYAVAQCGMSESLYYFLPNGRAAAGRYVANAAAFLGAAGLAVLVLLGLARRQVAGALGNPDLAPHLVPLGLFLLLMLASASFEVVLIARRRFLWASVSYGLSDLLRAAFLVLPAALTGRLDALLYGAVAYAALRLLAALAYFGAEFPGEVRLDRAALLKQLAYALPFGAAVLLEIFQTNLHQYVVSGSVSVAAFAVYAVGCLQVPLVDFVAGPAGNVLMVRLSEASARNDSTRALGLWHDTTRRLAFVFVPLVAVLVVTAPDLIVTLFTGAYLGSVPIFRAFSLTILLAIFQTDSVLRVHARTRFLLMLNLARLGFVIVAIHPFMGAYGLVGAVLVTLLAAALAKGVALLRVRRLLGTPLRRLLPWRDLTITLAASVAAAVVALGVRGGLGASAPAGLLAAGLAFGASYLACLAAGLRVAGAARPAPVCGTIARAAAGE